MEAKPYTKETGRMWRIQAQLIRQTLERLVRKNELSKLSVVASEIGMTEDEFSSKISITPRTPMEKGELVSVENFIRMTDTEVYQEYLRAWHCDDSIHVEI
jgi:hypothetical protein